MHFTIKTPIGTLRQIKTILPIEPFKQLVESTVPRIMAYIFSLIGAGTLEQDRPVWENKMFKMKPLWVSGDGPFPAFIRWYMQFYYENSKKKEDYSLEW